MAKAKKSFAKKFLIIGVSLAAIEFALVVYFRNKQQPMDYKNVMNTAVNKRSDITADKRSKMKLKLALADYRTKKGKYPSKLKTLVPDYFDSIPLDPDTGAPFKYSTTSGGKKYLLGSKSTSSRSGGKENKKTSVVPLNEEAALIASLDKSEEQLNYIYDPAEKRDPFRSYDFTSKRTIPLGNTPLEQYSYDELSLSAVLKGFGQPKALVELPSGKGHSVSIGTPIGKRGGKVVKIEDDRILILESVIEFTGEKKTETIEMFIR